MCGFVAHFDPNGVDALVAPRAMASIGHRGPDDDGFWMDPEGIGWMGHCRLSIIDLSPAGRQPFHNPSGRYQMVFNGELYNYVELKAELRDRYAFSTSTDTEVLLASYLVWGASCLDRFIGMFAFAIWDTQERTLFAARDRFGVKPLFYAIDPAGGLRLASEIKALHAIGVARAPNEETWSIYLKDGMYDHGAATFWDGIRRVLPGHTLHWTPDAGANHTRWYDLGARVMEQGPDERSDATVQEELEALLKETLHLRFRSDVPVGICLSGGLDSALLLGLIRRNFPQDQTVQSFTFYCNDERYDETPWVDIMIRNTQVHPNYCLLQSAEIPALAEAVQANQDEPFGGFPTLGMAKVHARARELGVTVLLDGNGVDEGWAGYEYYQRAAEVPFARGPVQGARPTGVDPELFQPGFAEQGGKWEVETPFKDPVLNLQYRDVVHTKIPRAMRFADRVSMMYSRELREPFLDHRIIELGLRQPTVRRIRNGQGKWLVRLVASQLLPNMISEAPKRPVQTPQREWLRGPLAAWADQQIERGLAGWGRDWLDAKNVRDFWWHYRQHGGDNSFPIWQWISLGLMQGD